MGLNQGQGEGEEEDPLWGDPLEAAADRDRMILEKERDASPWWNTGGEQMFNNLYKLWLFRPVILCRCNYLQQGMERGVGETLVS
jgi:hypothetical protein